MVSSKQIKRRSKPDGIKKGFYRNAKINFLQQKVAREKGRGTGEYAQTKLAQVERCNNRERERERERERKEKVEKYRARVKEMKEIGMEGEIRINNIPTTRE